MQLIYTDARPDPPGSALSLPEGWPALDHDEPDAAIAAAKIKSGSYKRKNKPRKSPGATNESDA